jgi:hypothetical protein
LLFAAPYRTRVLPFGDVSTFGEKSLFRRHLSRLIPILYLVPLLHWSSTVFKILRSDNREVVLALIGRMDGENLAELRNLITSEPTVHRMALDLKDLTLVNREVIQFLARCETDNITLKNCPAYIRDWIEGSRKRKPDRTE